MHSVQTRPRTSSPGDGSRTITVHDVQPRAEGSDGNGTDTPTLNGTLRLRGGPRSRPRVAWDEHVVDNENCGRKKSKICCIYHKPKEFDESSDEESSSDSDSEASDDGRARLRPNSQQRHHRHPDNTPSHPNGASGGRPRTVGDGGSVVREIEAAQEPNAYETQPPRSKKGKGDVHKGS